MHSGLEAGSEINHARFRSPAQVPRRFRELLLGWRWLTERQLPWMLCVLACSCTFANNGSGDAIFTRKMGFFARHTSMDDNLGGDLIGVVASLAGSQ